MVLLCTFWLIFDIVTCYKYNTELFVLLVISCVNMRLLVEINSKIPVTVVICHARCNNYH